MTEFCFCASGCDDTCCRASRVAGEPGGQSAASRKTVQQQTCPHPAITGESESSLSPRAKLQNTYTNSQIHAVQAHAEGTVHFFKLAVPLDHT